MIKDLKGYYPGLSRWAQGDHKGGRRVGLRESLEDAMLQSMKMEGLACTKEFRGLLELERAREQIHS